MGRVSSPGLHQGCLAVEERHTGTGSSERSVSVLDGDWMDTGTGTGSSMDRRRREEWGGCVIRVRLVLEHMILFFVLV